MDEKGFIKLSNYLTPNEADTIVSWANHFEEIKEQSGKWMIYFEPNGNRSRIENFLSFHPDIQKFVDEKITPLLESIIKEKVILFKEKMNWKQAGGKGFGAHQDHPAWNDFPPNKFYTVAVFGDNTTIDNGCLEFVSGKNKEVYPHDIKEDGSGSGNLINPEQFEWNHITTTTRDILVFDSYAPHRSDDNKTDKSRRIFYFTYNLVNDGDFHNSYTQKKREVFPPKNEREEGKVYHSAKYNLANPLI